MKKVFSSPDLLSIRALEAFLNSHGIDTLVLGEDRLSSSGIIAPIDCWIDLMVLDDDKEQVVRGYIQESKFATETVADSWKCEICGEVLDAQFTECWKCSLPTTDQIDQELPSDLSRQKTWFRILVILDLILSLVSYRLGIQADAAFDPTFLEACLATGSNPVWDYPGVVQGWYLLSCASLLGLLFFSAIARILYVCACVFYLVALLFSPSGMASTDGALSVVATLNFWAVGGILTLAFLSPLSHCFRRR